MPTLTFTYTVQISEEEATIIRNDQDVDDDGTVTAVTYGYGLLGQIVSRHGLPAVYRNHDTGQHETTQGHMRGQSYPRLPASIVLDDNVPSLSELVAMSDAELPAGYVWRPVDDSDGEWHLWAPTGVNLTEEYQRTVLGWEGK